MVEVGGALGPSFEAQAVNLSEEGMSLRTAYLPEVGQPVMCRFDAGQGMTVVAAGEVLWKDDMGDGGEFGIRFTNLDGASTVALQRIVGMAEEGQLPPAADPGRKVRLHIEGLASPMRARIKDQMAAGVTAYSELGFLQMGKPLELEDAMSGARRPALIDRVEVELSDGSRIPQLVVSLRYDDEDGRAASLAAVEVPVEDPNGNTPHDPAPEMEASDEAPESEPHAEPPAAEAHAAADEASIQEESNNLKSAFARNAAKVTPAILAWAKRAKTTAALVAARARRGASTGNDVEIPVRRTTAPAPGGGLHASGRKVVRGSIRDEHDSDAAEAAKKTGGLPITKKKAAIAASIGIATILVFIALRKPAPAPQLASAPPDTAAAAATQETTTAEAPPTGSPVAPPADPLAAAAAAMANGGPGAYPSRPGKPTPFTNGPVGSHPNVIKIKMDGPVEGILGATQPTGFTIVTPNRRALDPAGSLASKDSRLEGVQIANEGGSAELTVTFKDGVPNYIVRARGETLELVLAKPSGTSKAAASVKKKTTTTKSSKKR
ncbi:MAG: PilZ domain-containing protein [Labilithrix sp.]|nr:PilZ domain-containing protein [Labilithrix sp.]